MKSFYYFPILLLLISCSDKNSTPESILIKKNSLEVVVPEFQQLLDSAMVEGAILVYDLTSDTYFSNDFEWARKGKLPASTFKITNSIIALESGVMENDSSLITWNGEDRALSIWEQDLVLRDAFHYSCVPCYQEIARSIGSQTMNHYLDTLAYGIMDVNPSNIDLFWLQGESRITQFQQIDFLKRFYHSELPISNRTETIMKRVMIMEQGVDYIIRGKTGWSIQNKENNGWFVGYVESANSTFFFATNIEPTENFDMNRFSLVRVALTHLAFEQLGI